MIIGGIKCSGCGSVDFSNHVSTPTLFFSKCLYCGRVLVTGWGDEIENEIRGDGKCYGWGYSRNYIGQVVKCWVYDYSGNSHVIFDMTEKGGGIDK
jgi:ribosomal protein S27E